MEIKWDCSKEESEIIRAIMKRAIEISDQPIDPINLQMDITACHLNGNPLKLQELLEADNFNFLHDVFGISRHIDRNTGKLLDCFLPRFSK